MKQNEGTRGTDMEKSMLLVSYLTFVENAFSLVLSTLSNSLVLVKAYAHSVVSF